MSQRLLDHGALLQTLRKSTPGKRVKILKNSNDELINCLCECALNTINCNVPLSNSQLIKLRPHKQILRYLANKKFSLKNKRKKIVKQAGGFLLPLIIPILSSVLTTLIK
jgi:hypothetical protein